MSQTTMIAMLEEAEDVLRRAGCDMTANKVRSVLQAQQAEPVNQQVLAALKNLKEAVEYTPLGIRGLTAVQRAREAISAAEQGQESEQVNQQQAGVYHKFNVSRTDGRDQLGGDRHGAEYFVLDVTHDKFAKPALAAYAAACRNDYPALADDMARRYGIAQQQAEPVALALALPFFAYDSETGFERFATTDEAKAVAQESIDAYREEASEGWPEAVDNICWGMVLGTTREVALPDEYNGVNGLADDMKPVDYVLTDAQPPAAAAAAPDVVEQIAKQWDGCMCDIAAGCHIDIGQDIRQAGQRLAAAPQAAVLAGYHLVADATLRRAIVSLIDRVTSHALSCNETAVEQTRFINEIAAAQKGGAA
jgi:hypothetical protein